jgi:hypothetical protein
VHLPLVRRGGSYYDAYQAAGGCYSNEDPACQDGSRARQKKLAEIETKSGSRYFRGLNGRLGHEMLLSSRRVGREAV